MAQRASDDPSDWTPHAGPVLLIEPDPRQAIGLVRVLSPLSRIRLASGIADALTAATAETPDLLLVSDRLPEGGLAALWQARLDEPALAAAPVVVLVSQDDEAAEMAALRAGAVACLSRQAGPSLVAARLRRTLEMLRSTAYWRRSAESDALTGLANRRHLDVVLQREWRRAQRLQRPMALLMVDLDHFKAYNDHLGHVAGDQCLREVARILQQAMRRPTDLVGRYGGEEFAVVLSDTDGAGGLVVAERLQQAVADRALPHGAPGAASHVSVSIGVSAWEPGRGDPGVTALVQAADQAMYQSKRQGRNGVAWHSLRTPAPLPLAARRTLGLPPLFTGLAASPGWPH